MSIALRIAGISNVEGVLFRDTVFVIEGVGGCLLSMFTVPLVCTAPPSSCIKDKSFREGVAGCVQ